MPIIMNANHQHKLELQYLEKLERLNVEWNSFTPHILQMNIEKF